VNSTTIDSTSSSSDHIASLRKSPWNLVLVFGCKALRGKRWLFEGETEFGRANLQLRPELLEDSKLSRQHSRIGLSNGKPFIEDLGSRNGTFVNGDRISGRVDLKRLDTVLIGRNLFMVDDADPLPSAWAPKHLLGHSAAMYRIFRAAKASFESRSPVLLCGESGTGKALFAEELHDASGAKGPLLKMSLGSLGDAEAHSVLCGNATTPGLFAKAEGGTVVLERLESATSMVAQLLLDLIVAREFRAVGSSTPQPLACRMIVTLGAEPREAITRHQVPAGLVAQFEPWILVLPPLRERPEDIPLIAEEFIEKLDPSAKMTEGFVRQLLTREWAGNIDQLMRMLERAYLEMPSREEEEPLLSELGDEPLSSVARIALANGAVEVARDGAWFKIGHEPRIELDHRRSLKAMLGALIQKKEESSGRGGMSWEDLFRVGWPGERVQARAGASRVYVAVSTLRKMGLGDAIQRSPRGYSLTGEINVIASAEGDLPAD